MRLPIYQQEINDGLTDKLSLNSFAYEVLVTPSKEKIEASALNIAVASDESIDLYQLDSILVSTGINKNLDVFLKDETWLARDTPVNKPLNIGHDATKIRGHMTNATVLTDVGEVVPEDTPIDKLPDFNIVTHSVLYKVWKKNEDIQEEMNELIAEISDNKKFVSMECFFTNFDYALAEQIIPRNSETSYLTKYLTAYGGPGEYKGNKLSRVLRNITFSAQGIVERPANPKSIIFSKFNGTYSKADFGGNMSDELKKENDELKAKLEQTKAELAAKNAEKFEVKVTELEKTLAKAVAEKVEVDGKLTVSEAKITELTKNLTDVAAKSEKAEAELNKISAQIKTKDRISLVVAKGKTQDEAVAFEKQFTGLNDETFASVVALIAPKVEPKVEEKPAEATITTKELETKVDEPTLVVAETKDTDIEVAKAEVINEIKSLLIKEKK